MNKPKQIYVHCTATKPGRDFGAADIDRWHRDRGWSGIGYHYVIRLDGTEEIGRDPDRDGDPDEHVGAHVYGHNKNTLGVVYVGGVDEMGRPADTRTPAQREALFRLVAREMREHDIPIGQVYGHYEADAGKACPSFDMDVFRRQLGERFYGVPMTRPYVRVEVEMPTIALGAVGLPVWSLMTWLEMLGYGFGPSWYFGEAEKAAVVAFQSSARLSLDGIVGPKTWAVIADQLRKLMASIR